MIGEWSRAHVYRILDGLQTVPKHVRRMVIMGASHPSDLNDPQAFEGATLAFLCCGTMMARSCAAVSRAAPIRASH